MPRHFEFLGGCAWQLLHGNSAFSVICDLLFKSINLFSSLSLWFKTNGGFFGGFAAILWFSADFRWICGGDRRALEQKRPNGRDDPFGLFLLWCAWQDSNLHIARHQILSLARLPISPQALFCGCKGRKNKWIVQIYRAVFLFYLRNMRRAVSIMVS